MFWHSWISSSVGGCVTIPQVDTSIFLGINRSSDASINIFLCGSVRSLHIWIPNFQHWFDFVHYFTILFPNHKPCTNSNITAPPESSVNAVTPVHTGIFICSVYSGRNGDTVHFYKVNDIGLKLAPKQWSSAWLSIPLDNALQITLSWYLCTLLIIRRLPVLMLNTAVFKCSSGTRSASQVLVTRFPRWSYITTLRSSVLFLFEEVLPLFAEDTFILLSLVGKRFTPPANPDSFWLAFGTPVMI